MSSQTDGGRRSSSTNGSKVVRRSLSIAASVVSFLAGALLSPLIGQYAPALGRATSFFGVDYISAKPTWADPCTGHLQHPIYAESKGDPYFLRAEGKLDNPIFLQQQGELVFAVRPRFAQTLVIEDITVETSKLEEKAAWASRALTECGGAPVDKAVYLLDLDNGTSLKQVSPKGKRKPSTRVVVTDDDPTDLLLLVSSCSAKTARLKIQYSVGGFQYEYNLPPIHVNVSSDVPRFEIELGTNSPRRKNFRLPCADGNARNDLFPS